MLVIGILLGGAAVYTTNQASAHYGQNKGKMADELASKLNVTTDQVQTAMDQVRDEHQAARQKESETKLDQAVKDGVLTADQKQKLLDKRTQLKAERAQRQKEMEQWYKDNGVDATKLGAYLGRGGQHGRP